MALFAAPVLALFTVAAQIPPPPPPMPQPPVQGPVRDPGRRPPAEPTGTAIIRGRVVAADTGNPIRRANVSLMPAPPPPPPTSPGTPPGAAAAGRTTTVISSNGGMSMIDVNISMRPRTAVTDAQGGFEFTGLPAGTYRVQASAGQYQAAYLGISYGGKRPIGGGSMDLGLPIVLAEGQAFDKVTIGLPRGAVITGRVTDENGEPMARVQVFTMFYPTPAARGQRTGAGAQTDDLGQFRLFGLSPGDYVVAAEARSNTFVPPNAPADSEDDRTGFMTTYYPAALDESAAQRVRTRAGGETPGLEIRMAVGRLYHLSGLVTDSQGRPAVRANGSVTKRTPGAMSSYGFSTDEQGRFQMRNIAPGNYRVTVRQQVQRGPNGQAAPGNEPGEFASVPVNIAADMEGLLIVTGPGATITGQIVLEQGPAQLPAGTTPGPIRINAVPGDPENQIGVPGPQSVTAAPDLTFTLKGMMGEYVLRASTQGQYLKAVMLGSDDITDTPREFKSGDRLTFVMTTRASVLEGNVTDDKGEPVTDAGIILFSEDKASWRNNSSRTRRSSVAPNGHYRMPGLMPGRYFVAALPRERLNGPFDAATFEQLAKEAVTVVVGEDETRQADLKLLGSGGGM